VSSRYAADWEVDSAQDQGAVDEGLEETAAAWGLRNQTWLLFRQVLLRLDTQRTRWRVASRCLCTRLVRGVECVEREGFAGSDNGRRVVWRGLSYDISQCSQLAGDSGWSRTGGSLLVGRKGEQVFIDVARGLFLLPSCDT
jgi:hypothetical protein